MKKTLNVDNIFILFIFITCTYFETGSYKIILPLIVIFKCENADTNKRPNYKNKPVQHELLAVKLFMVLVYQMNFSRAVAAENMYPTP